LCKFEKILCPSCEGKLEYIGVKNKRRTFNCIECNWEGSSAFKYEKYKTNYRGMEKKCNRCGAGEGALHEFFCEMEYCPYCGRSLMSDECGCLYKELGYENDPPNVPDHFITEGWTDKDVEESLKILENKGRIPNIHYPIICPNCGVLWPVPFDKSEESVYGILLKNRQYSSLCYTCFKEIKLLIETGKESEIYFPDRCSYCGNESIAPLNVQKEEWDSYIQPNMRDKLICQACFDSIKSKIEKYK
jgi:hypothetical protein